MFSVGSGAMSKKSTCVLLYSNHKNLEQDVSTLQNRSFDMKAVSIVGKVEQHKTHATGLYITAGQIRYQGNQDSFWNGLWLRLNGAGFFLLPDLGVLLAAGPIAHLLTKEYAGIDVGSGLSVLGQAFFGIGIPIDSIHQYEKSVNSEKLMLIIHGLHSDVEFACQLLHSKTQQVTVHLA
jgi:hypothetical protein